MKLIKNTNTNLRIVLSAFFWCAIGILLISTGCNKSIEDKIGKKIEDECSSKTACVISIKTITDFEWEKMYVFGSSARLEDINKALGFEYPYYKEFSRIIVFMDNGKIVYHEENSSNVEHLEDKDVIFNYGHSLKYSSYNMSDAVFKAQINQIENGVYYELTPVR